MNAEELKRRATCRWPILGGWVRRRAIDRLQQASRHPQALRVLLELRDHEHTTTANRCRMFFDELDDAASVDALCELAIAEPTGPATKICLCRNLQSSEHDRICVFLFVTKQLDAYFEEDYDFQCLRQEYDTASPDIRQHILRILRSGDRRCFAFFSLRKLLSECSEQEILRTLRSFFAHQDWPRLFRAFQELPLRFGLRVLHDLARTDWEPELPEERSLYRQVILDARGQLSPPSRPASPAGKVFEEWLEEGHRESFASHDVDSLLDALPQSTPPRAVAIVAALARRASPGSEAARIVLHHPHWLVRLAGHVTGLCIDFEQDRVVDPVAWVPRIAPELPLLEFQPSDTTPALLDSLSAAVERDRDHPLGPLQTARKVLQTLMAQRTTVGSFEEMLIEVEPFAGEFEAFEEADE
jgi:hypothetical protein